MARFLEMRMLYEVRERPSRTFAWTTFVVAEIVAELPNQTLMAVITFVSWYYPLRWYHNAAETGDVAARGGLTFLHVWAFMLWAQTYTQMVGTFAPDAATGIAVGNVLYILSLLFSG